MDEFIVIEPLSKPQLVFSVSVFNMVAAFELSIFTIIVSLQFSPSITKIV